MDLNKAMVTLLDAAPSPLFEHCHSDPMEVAIDKG